MNLTGGISRIQTLPRLLKIKLPKGKSAFLWGPRKTGTIPDRDGAAVGTSRVGSPIGLPVTGDSQLKKAGEGR